MGFLLNKFSPTSPAVQALNIAGGIKPKKSDLTTLEGLQSEAEKSGLKEESDKILRKKGEQPKKIFSGGFISDIFDTLNALQYGVTGAIKGKGFLEGVKTRQSFSDQDALGEHGLPGAIGGIVMDIAVDPLTYMGGFGLLQRAFTAVGKLKGVTKLGQAAKSSKVGDFLGRKFVYRFGQDPIYKQIAMRSEKNIAVGVQNILDIAKPLIKLNRKDQQLIAAARKAGKLDELPTDLLDKAKPVFTELDRLGKESVELGLLSAETYHQNVGKYLARLYRTKEIPGEDVLKIKSAFAMKPKRIDISRFKKRTDIPEEVREAMGEIMEAGYPSVKGIVQLTQANERARFFKEVARKWGSTSIDDGLKNLPVNNRLGDLSGMSVPAPIFDDIQEILRVRTGVTRKIVAGFKFGKVLLNPSTHARNIMSNFLLNDFEGLSPARIDIYARAAKSIAKKDKFWKEAAQEGLGINTFAAQEVKNILLSPETKKLGSKVRGALDKIGDIYQKEEQFAKMAQFIFQRGKGKTVAEAARIAERATFNYAQVTPFIRRLRESIFGFPFITFTAKATPQVAKTLVTKPTKISNIGKIKQAIESQSDIKELEAERAKEPFWVRDGFYVKLPGKDEFGRSKYFDLTYILPFGDLMSGELLFARKGVERETGLPESLPSALTQSSPFFNFVKQISKNQDFYGNKIWRDSDSSLDQSKDLMRHIIATYAPPLISDQIPGGHITRGKKSGTRRDTVISKIMKMQKTGLEEVSSSTRTLDQELLRLVGLKIQPFDQATQDFYSDSERRKAIETLLKENGIIQEFKRPFVPKK